MSRAGTGENQDTLPLLETYGNLGSRIAQKAGTRMFSAIRGIFGNIRARVSTLRDSGTSGNQDVLRLVLDRRMREPDAANVSALGSLPAR